MRSSQGLKLDWLYGSDDPPSLSCPWCDKSLSSPWALRDHWRSHHPQETGHTAMSTKTSAEKEEFIRKNLNTAPERFILPLFKESSSENRKFKMLQTSYRLSFSEAGIEAVTMGYGQEMLAAVLHYVTEEIKRRASVTDKSYLGWSITAQCLETPLTVTLRLNYDK